jgi:hypothetical protein
MRISSRLRAMPDTKSLERPRGDLGFERSSSHTKRKIARNHFSSRSNVGMDSKASPDFDQGASCTIGVE